MVWLIAMVIWLIILVLPKAMKGIKFILGLSLIYAIRQALNTWADHHVVLAVTLSVLFFGSIIGVWIAQQISITRYNKRIDAENAAKKAQREAQLRLEQLKELDSEI